MTTPKTRAELDALVERAVGLDNNALEGPWQLVEEILEVNDLGLEKGIKPRKIYVLRTQWVHAQLKAPAPVIWQSFSPYYQEKHFYFLSKEDGEFIAQSRTLVPELTAALTQVRAELSTAQQDRAAVRKEALEEACDAICLYCREGVPIKEIPHEFAKDRTEFVHYYLEPEFDFMPRCNGHLIRKLIAEADQGQGKEG